MNQQQKPVLTHPEVITQPGHQPVLGEAHPASVVDDEGPANGHEGADSNQASDNTRPLLLGVLVQIKMPDGPVTDGCPKLQRAAKEGLVNPSTNCRIRSKTLPG